MDVDKPTADRRRFYRFPVDYPISYTSEHSHDISTGMTVNLSEGGLLACLFDRISVGTQLDLEMFYTSELQFTSLSAQAKIIWKDITEIREAIEYQYGIEFIKINRGEKAKLCKLLDSIRPAYHYPLKENILNPK